MAAPARGGRLDGMDQHTPTSSAATTGSDAFSAGPADPGRASASVDAGPIGTASRFTLRRSRSDRMLGGVCGGLAESLGADPALLRVLLVALTLITGGAAAVVYLAAWALAPDDDCPSVGPASRDAWACEPPMSAHERVPTRVVRSPFGSDSRVRE